MTTGPDPLDPLVPPAWQAVDRLLDEIVPTSTRFDDRYELDNAITSLVIEAETLAVKRHGQILLKAIWGERFQEMSELWDEL